jgi:hypothetical protein
MADENGHRSDAELGELAAFADGSLVPPLRTLVAARVDASPELRALVDEQRRALTVVRALDVPAPARLRARVGVSRPRARSWAGLRIPAFAAAALAVAAAVVLAVVAGGPNAPSFNEAAGVAQLGPTGPAPPPDSGDPNLLAASVDGVAFPDYSRAFGWRAKGERSDELDGRTSRTIYYRRGGRDVAYTIVSGEALTWPAGARTMRRDGVELRLLARDGAAVVTWIRDGRTCVLSSEGTAVNELVELAAWMGEGSVEF